jgi:hypothetical protein
MIAAAAIERDVRREGPLRVLRKHMLKTMLRDRVRGPEVPLAELRRGVTRVLQSRGDGGLLVEAVERGAVVVEIEAALEPPRHHAAA